MEVPWLVSCYFSQPVLVSEPEAASIFYFKENKILPSDGQTTMLLDCGGGTTDLLAFRTQTSKNGIRSIEEIISPIGEKYGSSILDDQFDKFLEEALGENLYFHLLNDLPVKYLELMRNWEIYKCSFTSGSTSGDLVLDIGQKLIEDSQYKIAESLSFTKNRFEDLFDKTKDNNVISGIFDQIREGLNKIQDKGLQCDRLLVVGGYSKSKLLRSKIKEEFKNGFDEENIVFPDRDGNAVLKGAVYFGMEPDLYRKRIATSTYGFGCSMSFEEGKDPERYGQTEIEEEVTYEEKVLWWTETKKKKEKVVKKFVCQITNIHLCKNRFSTFLPKGKTIELNLPIEKTYKPVTLDQCSMQLTIYKTNESNVRYTDGCEKVHSFSVAKDKEWKAEDWSVEILLYCRQGGEIEFEVYSVNKSLRKREPIHLSSNRTNIILETLEV